MSATRLPLPSLAALALPVLAGIAWMAATGAPQSYLAVNGAALALAALWMVFGKAPLSLRVQRAIAILLIAGMLVPLASGPHINGIARWLPLGPVTLHAGMLVLPALSVLAVRDADYLAPMFLAVLFAALLQPDAATGFAVTFAAVGLHHVTKDWRAGAVAIVGFFASIGMALRGELPPRQFVERVLLDAMHWNPAAAACLALALAGSYFLVLWATPLARRERFALAGSLFGFIIMAMMSHYPFPLIGYGAAPILGYGIALGLVRKEAQ